ncbi:hypothetical protein GOBAR_AA24922 [Gossypium barbadense]|uniref:Nucleolar protein 14 n=1 Tax=Gossypium barbadense TaxID=3634 RepID=A0A2P5WXD9_GOSBA|nr:hypothetical protein GOBAR_AA24922 [Gossypium barbadense]
MAKQSTPGAKTKKKSNKKHHKKSDPDAISMKLKSQKPNPFETIWSRRKFDILGKKRKGEERRIGLARSLAIQKRKKTLLKEYEQSTKSSVFVDKRIGEQNDDMGEFEKGILRSQRERQLKLGKRSKFNLSDGEEDEFDAPDFGSLPERDDFEDEMLSDDDNYADEKRSTVLKHLNSHSAKDPLEGDLIEGEENKHKSKKEIMEEVILKSKFFKAQKARDKEENEQLMDELDKSFSSLVQSQALLSLTEPGKMNALKALVNKSIPDEHVKKEELAVTQKAVTNNQEQPDSYDKLVHEMVLDMRARPSDRTKTPEEIAQEERERLKRLEEERQKRMLAMDYSSDEDGENAEKDYAQRPRAISGDDLGDSFALDDEPGSVDAKKPKASGKHTSTKLDIPFIIEAPKNLEELSSLLENRSNDDVIVIINRIRASNAIKLAAENRKKMQVFYGVLLQYFAVLANKKPLNFELSNKLVKPIMEMSTEIPFFSAICARERILRTRVQFCEALKNHNGCWPTLKTLFLLRLWSMIFPCSDYRHVVTTPALLLMCEYLMRCPIMSGRDIAIGSFLCSMILMFMKQSRKFCPEAIMFLRSLLMAATEHKLASEQDSQFYHFMELKALRPLLCIHDGVDEINPLNFLMVMEMSDDSLFFRSDNFRASALLTVIETLQGFIEIYDGLNSFPEIFLPIATLLVEVSEQKHMPKALKDKFNIVSQLIKKKADETHTLRRPLQLRKQKPAPIKLLNPKFEENFVKGRDYDPDRERAERRKLQKLIKREAKGAARELRKDNYFLYEAKQRDRELVEKERAANYGRAIAFLQEQEHAFKSGQLALYMPVDRKIHISKSTAR